MYSSDQLLLTLSSLPAAPAALSVLVLRDRVRLLPLAAFQRSVRREAQGKWYAAAQLALPRKTPQKPFIKSDAPAWVLGSRAICCVRSVFWGFDYWFVHQDFMRRIDRGCQLLVRLFKSAHLNCRFHFVSSVRVGASELCVRPWLLGTLRWPVS